jgi:hypothetical protein
MKKYLFTLPDTLDGLLSDSEDQSDVKRLYRLAYAKAIFQAVRDWPRFRQDDGIMWAAKEACKQLLLEEIEEGIDVTNATESFIMLFVQTYYGAYQGIILTAQRSFPEMLALVRLVRHRTEADAIVVLDEVEALTRSQRPHF